MPNPPEKHKPSELIQKELATADIKLSSQHEYPSRISYAVYDLAKIWQLIQAGTHIYLDSSSNYIGMGPIIGNLGKEPQIKCINQQLAVKLQLESGGGYFRNKPDSGRLTTLLSQVLEDTIEVDGRNIYLVMDGAQRSRLASFKDDGFLYEPSDYKVDSVEALKQHLYIALEMYRVIATELYRANEAVEPADQVVLRPPQNKLEISSKYLRESLQTGTDAKRETLIVREAGNVSFADIAGQPLAVAAAERLAQVLKFPDAYAFWGSKPPRGILLYGPPGTGKTTLAKAIANEADAHFFHVKASDIVGEGLYGQTEKEADQVFTLATEVAVESGKHSIIFIDEANLLLPASHVGQSGRHEATGKVIGVFAERMDGLISNPHLTVVLSANDPLELDPKILSRMTEQIKMPLPHADGLRSIFRLHMNKKEAAAGRQLFAEDIQLELISQVAFEHGMSGRDVEDVLHILLAKRGQLQLNRIIAALHAGKIETLESDVRLAVRHVMTSLQQGQSTYSDFLEPVISTEEVVETLRQSKVLVTEKTRATIGFKAM